MHLASALALIGGIALAGLPESAAAEECPNAAFRTGPSTHLPDCRAYELVSPAFKDAGRPFIAAIGPDGASVLLGIGGAVNGLESFPDSSAAQGPEGYYTTSRTPTGWVTVPDDPPSSEYISYLGVTGSTDLVGQSLDQETTVWTERGRWQADNSIDFFLRRPDRSIVDVGTALPPTVPPGVPGFDSGLGGAQGLKAVGVSSDASHLFFSISNEHWPFDSTEGGRPSLYEYVGTDNTTPMLVAVEDGKQLGQCGVVLGGGDEGGSSHNAVSTNGDTVFLTALPKNFGATTCKGSAPPVREIFARIDNGLPDAHTIAISEPSKEDCAACDTEAGVLADARFVGASEDGSRVYFSTTQPLLGDDASSNIYEYDFDAPPGQRIVRVSGGDSTVSTPTAEAFETPMPVISEDGSHVYFLAKGVLTKAPNQEGETAEAGAPNLYMFEQDANYPEGRTVFVARLSPLDLAGGGGAASSERADVTPNGGFLVFTSDRDLTPDDTSTAEQVFEYDAQTGALTRVSIGQDGFNHDGNVAAEREHYGFVTNNAEIVEPTYEGEYRSWAYWSRLTVSDDGSYVFFQSPVGLTPQAVEGASNIYEYHAGQVSLISDGNDDVSPVRLIGTDASGVDVFFETVDQLVGQDTDDQEDIYDARIDGGFPAPASPPSCAEDTCQGALSGAPTLLSPGSEFQVGANAPLAGSAQAKSTKAGKPKAKHKNLKTKHKKPKAKLKRGLGHAKRRVHTSTTAAAGSRNDRRAGRS